MRSLSFVLWTGVRNYKETQLYPASSGKGKTVAKTRGFHAVKITDDEMELKIKEHKRKKRKVCLYIVGAVLLTFLIVKLAIALGSYDSYRVRSSSEIGTSNASSFAGFKDYVLQYSNDGVVCMDAQGNLLWNQAFDMTNPRMDICGDYLIVYDQGGTEIYILTESGLQKEMEMVMPIRTACVAGQGSVAVLLEESDNSYVRLFDKNGEQLAGGQFYASEGGLPVDIALSSDAQKLAVDMIDISAGQVDSVIAFYNFGSVGKNEIDNNVGSFTYENTLIPEIDFLDANTMLAVGDSQIIVFEGSQKPQPKRTITYKDTPKGIFHNDSYIGVIYDKGDEENTSTIEVFDTKGNSVMEHETSILYEDVYLLDNNEICVLGQYSCELFTIHSIQKFEQTFDEELKGFIYAGSLNNYIVVRSGIMEQIKLR